MPGFRSSKRMGDFMQQRIDDLFRRIVSGVVLGDLNPFRPVIASTLATFRSGPSERPVVQAVLQEFLLCNGFQFLQVHTSNPGNASQQLRLRLHGKRYIATVAGQTVVEGMAVLQPTTQRLTLFDSLQIWRPGETSGFGYVNATDWPVLPVHPGRILSFNQPDLIAV